MNEAHLEAAGDRTQDRKHMAAIPFKLFQKDLLK